MTNFTGSRIGLISFVIPLRGFSGSVVFFGLWGFGWVFVVVGLGGGGVFWFFNNQPIITNYFIKPDFKGFLPTLRRRISHHPKRCSCIDLLVSGYRYSEVTFINNIHHISLSLLTAIMHYEAHSFYQEPKYCYTPPLHLIAKNTGWQGLKDIQHA